MLTNPGVSNALKNCALLAVCLLLAGCGAMPSNSTTASVFVNITREGEPVESVMVVMIPVRYQNAPGDAPLPILQGITDKSGVCQLADGKGNQQIEMTLCDVILFQRLDTPPQRFLPRQNENIRAMIGDAWLSAYEPATSRFSPKFNLFSEVQIQLEATDGKCEINFDLNATKTQTN